ncbi:MAG: radical SAM protein, partial [Candidatus Woesearchaeota archaeon]
MASYKLNRYIIFKEIENEILALNLFNKKTIVISREKYQLIKRYENDISYLKYDNKNLFSLLYKLDFILDSSRNELDELKFIYLNQIYRDTSYRLTLIPSLECNFNCWYCYESKSNGYMTDKVKERIISHVNHKINYEKISFIDLDWFGGEPLLYFDEVVYPISLKILEIARKKNLPFKNRITTNGYLLDEERIKKLNEIKLNNFQITIDGSEEFHQKVKKGKDTYKRTIENINMMTSYFDDIHLLLRVNMSNENLESIPEIIKDIPVDNRRKIEIAFQEIWQIKNNINKGKDNLPEIFKKEGFKINEYFPPRVQGCYADKLEQAVINYDGLVYKCTARDFIEQNSDGYLKTNGEIEWNS